MGRAIIFYYYYRFSGPCRKVKRLEDLKTTPTRQYTVHLQSPISRSHAYDCEELPIDDPVRFFSLSFLDPSLLLMVEIKISAHRSSWSLDCPPLLDTSSVFQHVLWAGLLLDSNSSHRAVTRQRTTTNVRLDRPAVVHSDFSTGGVARRFPTQAAVA